MKSARFGLALEFHRSRDPQRLAILLLILALALLVLWLIGSIAKERGLMRHNQANTVRHREVLSVIYLGIRIIERAQDHFTAAELCIAWQSIPLRNARVPNLESFGVLSLWVLVFAARLWWLKAYSVTAAGRLT